MPASRSLTVDWNVPVPMRDGTILYADVYRPTAPGRYPTLLERTPYDKAALHLGAFMLRAATSGYAVVAQDVRGRFASDGAFVPFVHERHDGYDTLEWLVAQPWCDGSVGMYSQSYLGLTQWQTALSGHPALKAIVPGVTAGNYHDGWVYQGGAFELSFNLSWTMTNLAPNTILRGAGALPSTLEAYQTLLSAGDNLADEFRRLPLAGHPLLANHAPYYDQWLAHPTYDDFWASLDVSAGYHTLTVPALNIGGWYDIFLKGTIENFAGPRAAPTPEDRTRQRLLLGPWNHSGMRRGNPIGTVDFGLRSTGAYLDVDGLHLRWYDRWLRGIDNGVDAEPPIQLFVMGANEWRHEDEWPLARTDWQAWFLHSDGKANSLRGDGVLSRQPPAAEPPDAYVYNPRNPVPTAGGGLCCNPVFSQGGAFDQRAVEAREDVLVYTTPPLAQPLEVTGPVTLTLYASSSALDTDFTAKLVDVAPCGFARNLTDGIIRARYRHSMREPSLLPPNEVVEYTIDLVATSNVFHAGHRVRVEIASSNFPRFDRNPNTGELPGHSTRLESALQKVFHEATFPSRLILPVIAGPA